MADIKDPIAWCEEMVKGAGDAEIWAKKNVKNPKSNCFFYSAAITALHPDYKLIRGRHTKQHAGDTAHFWVQDKNGRIFDPTSAQYTKGDLVDGSPVSLEKNIDFLVKHPLFKTLPPGDQEKIKSSSFGIRMSKEASLKKKAQPKPVQGVQPVQGVEEGPKVTSAQKQQELDAWGRWIQDRNKDDFKFLLDSYTPFMNYMGQRHIQAAKTGGTLPVSTIKADMIQNFHRGLETFDPNKGALNTHIGNHLRHTGRFVRTYSNIGKMPDPRSRMVWQYKDRETVLTERLGRPPSSVEMADDLGVSQKEIELLRTEIRKDIIVDPTTSGLGSIAPESPKAMEQLNFLHMELNPEQQNVLEYTYGMHGRQAIDNNEDLARILGISPQKVRAIKRQIARRYEKRYR